MKQPTVTRIRVDYDDGSYDTIELLQRGKLPLFGLARNGPDLESPSGAYTTGAIAALLFCTAIKAERTEYSPADKQIAGLLRHWASQSQPQE